VALTPPAWYQGGFPDRELLVMDILEPRLAEWAGGTIRVVSWLPDDAYSSPVPIVRVYRTGGGVTGDAGRDVAVVQVAVLAPSDSATPRADAWAVMEFCRQVLHAYATLSAAKRAGVDSVEEVIGPQQIPDVNPDGRLVTVSFQVGCRVPRGTPDYARVIENL
jgi:hypothetical protein